MSAKQYEQHPYGQLIPKMQAAQFAELQKSIEANGLQIPIKLFQGQVLDGWNRYTACNNINENDPEHAVSIKYEDFQGTEAEALSYVLAANLARRHLTENDRLKVALKVRKELKKLAPDDRPEGKIDAEAAKVAGIGERTVSRAAKVEAYGDEELTEAMEAGDVSARAAEKLIKADTAKIKEALGKVKGKKGKSRAEVLKQAIQSSVKDLAKRAVPKSLIKLFSVGDDLDTISQELKRIMKMLKKCGELLPAVYTQTIISNITTIDSVITAESPAWVCQGCDGSGQADGKKCSICKGQGYLKRGNGKEPRWK